MRVAAFQNIAVNLAQHAAVSEGNRQHPRRRPQTDHAHEDQRPHQLGDAAQHDQHPAQQLPQQRRQRRHAAGQRRDRQGPRRQQRGGYRHHQRQRDAGGGDGHGAPGLACHQEQEIPVRRGREKRRQKRQRRPAALRIEQYPGPELGGHEQRPQQRQRRAGPEQARQPGGVAIRRAAWPGGGVHSRQFIGNASPPATAWNSLPASGLRAAGRSTRLRVVHTGA